MSSRNARLGAEDRAAAAVLHRALLAGRGAVEGGASAGEVEALLGEAIAAEPRAALVSADLRDAKTLAPVDRQGPPEVVLLVAARFGGVLLIDQMTAEPGGA
jgi:pantoate--beta-alanine ligase